MLFMWMDLTVIWIDSSFQVMDVQHAHRWHPAYFSHKPARYILEVSAENHDRFRVGDQLSFEKGYAA
jgi:uncharacterized membrane protein (UPF0127 family)